MNKFFQTFAVASLSLVIAGCAGERLHRQGLELLSAGKSEEGIKSLQQASLAEPGNIQFRSDFLSKRDEQLVRLLNRADSERVAGHWQEAETQYQRAASIDASNARVKEGLEMLARSRGNAGRLDQVKEAIKNKDFDRAGLLLRLILNDEPAKPEALELQRQLDEVVVSRQLSAPSLIGAFRKPITLQFRDASLRMVLDGLARGSGVDFILDKDVRPDLRTTVYLRQTPLEDALNLILQTNNLEKKILNGNSILIFANTPEKLKDYQELVVKGFYLSNADAKQTQALIKSMLRTKDTFVDEKLNLLVIRDTPEAIRLAEKLIALHDLAEPEVMLDVEVLEVKRSRLTELGIQWSNQLTVTPLVSKTPTLEDLRGLNASRLGIDIPSATVNFRRELGDANILANPRIRARNREKAKIMIGDKVPVTSNTATATGLVSESVQYLDVGIKLEAEPTVYLQGDVAIKIGLEVSTIVREIRTPGGSLAYQIGSRSAGTVLRLKDGETQVLAGLISDEERRDASRIPAIGDLPIVGRLFGSQKDDHAKTEIVLSITPHLIRNVERPTAAAGEFWSGTETTLKTKPLSLESGGDGNSERKAEQVTSTASQEAPTALGFSWVGPSKVKKGETFKLALKMSANGGVRSVPVQIGFDSTRLQIVDIAEGNYFKKDGTQTSMSSNVNAEAGKAMVSVVRSGSGGTRGDDDVLVLTVRAVDASASEIKLLSTAPMGVGDKIVTPTMPAPFSLSVTE